MSDMPLDTVPFQPQRLVDVVKGIQTVPGSDSGLLMGTVSSIDYAGATAMVFMGGSATETGPIAFMRHVCLVVGGNAWIARIVHDGAPTYIIVGSTSDPFTDWTPGITAASVAPSLGTGTSQAGRFKFENGSFKGTGSIVVGATPTSGTGTYYLTGLPGAPLGWGTRKVVGTGFWYDASLNQLFTFELHYNNGVGTTFTIAQQNGTWFDFSPSTGLAQSDQFDFEFDYEAA
jgi:hypothetical protein